MGPDEPLDLIFEASGEGASPPLVDLLRRAASGPVDVDQLESTRRKFLEGVDEAESSLRQLMEALPPEAARRCAPPYAAAQKALSALRSAACASAPVLQAAISRADQALATARETAVVALGPTALGGVNLICHVLEDLASGRTPVAALDFAIANESASIRAALARRSEGALAEAFRGLRSALQPLIFRHDPCSAERLLEMRVDLAAAARRLEDAAGAGLSLIEALIRVLRSRGDVGPLSEEIPLLRADLAGLRTSLSASVHGPSSPELGTRSTATIELIEQCDRLLEELLSGKDVAVPLADALAGLLDLQRRVDTLAELEGKTPCVRCGTYNPPDRRACGSCGAILPVQSSAAERSSFDAWDEGAPQAQEFEMTENIRRILSAIDAFAEGRSSPDALLAEVEWLESHLENARSLQIDDASVAQAHAAYISGIDEMAAGTAWLREALYEGTAGSLERGRQALLEGATTVQSAQRTVSP